MTIEKLRDKIAEKIARSYNLDSGVFRISMWEIADDILSISIGGEVVESVSVNLACGPYTKVKTHKTRPRLLRDCVEEER